jgi:hypothetical protein
MDFESTGFDNLDFSPSGESSGTGMLAAIVAETTIIRGIVEGSGGPENVEMSEAGLRLVRHLLSVCSSTPPGSLPNFKNPEAIQETAREFIRQCGSAASALQVMYSLMQPA